MTLYCFPLRKLWAQKVLLPKMRLRKSIMRFWKIVKLKFSNVFPYSLCEHRLPMATEYSVAPIDDCRRLTIANDCRLGSVLTITDCHRLPIAGVLPIADCVRLPIAKVLRGYRLPAGSQFLPIADSDWNQSLSRDEYFVKMDNWICSYTFREKYVSKVSKWNYRRC